MRLMKMTTTIPVSIDILTLLSDPFTGMSLLLASSRVSESGKFWRVACGPPKAPIHSYPQSLKSRRVGGWVGWGGGNDWFVWKAKKPDLLSSSGHLTIVPKLCKYISVEKKAILKMQWAKVNQSPPSPSPTSSPSSSPALSLLAFNTISPRLRNFLNLTTL